MYLIIIDIIFSYLSVSMIPDRMYFVQQQQNCENSNFDLQTNVKCENVLKQKKTNQNVYV